MRFDFLALAVSFGVILFSCSEKTEPIPAPVPDPDPDPVPEFIEEPDDESPDFKGSLDYASLANMKHPRLLMTGEEFEIHKKKVTSDRVSNMLLYKVHSLIMNQSDEYLSKSETIEPVLDAAGKRLLPMSKKALKRIAHFAYSYKMTGEKKYLKAATDIMDNVCSWETWQPNGSLSNQSGYHFLDVAEMCMAVAIGYDWLYYDLSYETRVKAHSAMMRFGIELANNPNINNGRGPNYFKSVNTNWNQVCYSGLTLAAIALYEKDRQACGKILESCISDNLRAQQYIYAPDGIYPEGYMYWTFGTEAEVLLITALQTAFGTTCGLDTDGFMKSGLYPIYMVGPTKKNYNYYDNATDAEQGHIGTWWYAGKTGDMSYLCHDIRLINKSASYPTGGDNVRMLPFVPAYVKNINLGNPSSITPDKNVWFGSGETPLIIVRKGWKNDNTDVYLACKGGTPGSSHSHLDEGSFVFDAFGYRWSEDLGRDEYVRIEPHLSDFWTMTQNSRRWKLFRYNNIGHSTITVNDSDYRVNASGSTSLKVDIEEVFENGDSLGGKFNMTPVLSTEVDEAHRKIVVIGNELVVIDEIKAKQTKAAEVQWRMITSAVSSIASDGITLTQGSVSMKLAADVAVTYKKWSAVRPDTWFKFDYDTENLGKIVVGYTVTIPAGKSMTLKTKLTKVK